MFLSAEAIAALPQRFRAQLINCLPGFKPGVLLGTADSQKRTNLAVISSVFHLGAAPPLLGMVLRPNPPGSERHSLDNLLETGVYTLNAIPIGAVAAAHQTSARYPREQSEFDACGFTADWLADWQAPFVGESPLQIGCRLREHQVLAINDTHLVIGEIMTLKLPDEAVRSDGSVDLPALEIAAITGLDSYHAVQPGERFAYAKPDSATTRIDSLTKRTL